MINTLSRFKVNVRSKVKNIKNCAQKSKEDFSKAKKKPRSKRKSLLLGFTTVLGIFGVTLFAPVLGAIAKDVPKPGETCPAPGTGSQPALVPSEKVISGLSGAAAGMFALAVGSGSFLVGAVCAVIVGVGILKAQEK